jgi:hypothetical protein
MKRDLTRKQFLGLGVGLAAFAIGCGVDQVRSVRLESSSKVRNIGGLLFQDGAESRSSV